MSEKKIIGNTDIDTSTLLPTTSENQPPPIPEVTNTPLIDRQQNTIQQYVLPLATDFTKGIALTPNVLPTELRIGAAYEDALRLAAEQPNKLSTKVARMTTVIPHFYTIDSHMDMKPVTYPIDTLSTFDGDKIVDYTCQAYNSEKRPKLGTLMIDFNDKNMDLPSIRSPASSFDHTKSMLTLKLIRFQFHTKERSSCQTLQTRLLKFLNS